jgi:NADH:ubiquinone oxidoreductase subunit C
MPGKDTMSDSKQFSDSVAAAIKARIAVVSENKYFDVLNIGIKKEDLRSALAFLHDELSFDYMDFMTAIDWPESNIIEVIYSLFSFEHKAAIVIRIRLDRSAPAIDTVSGIYRTAEWHEREASEMFGIAFADHPDPRKLLLPDDFEGYPLRKDFTHENLIPLPEVK